MSDRVADYLALVRCMRIFIAMREAIGVVRVDFSTDETISNPESAFSRAHRIGETFTLCRESALRVWAELNDNERASVEERLRPSRVDGP
jgi:hypothetical protein